jgi:hypothetical protein
MRSILADVQEFLRGKRGYLVAVVSIFALIPVPRGASAFNQPGMNLGFTSFADAGAPPEGYVGPRIILSEVVQWWDAPTFRDADGDKIPGGSTRVSLLVQTHQVYFLPKLNDPLTGSQLGLDVIVPVVLGSVSIPGNSDSDAGGLGDFIFSPVFQWNNHKIFGLLYYHRFQVHVTAPTADFDSRFSFHPGDNVWSVAPYYAQTLWLLPYVNLEISLRHQWRYCTTNPETDIQPGQIYYVNYAASYGLTQTFRVGLNGYALQQLTNDELKGHDIEDSKERVIALGPGIVYNKGDLTFMVNYFREFAAENRPEGFRLSTRVIYKF